MRIENFLKKIFLAGIMLTNFINFAYSQNKKLSFIEGIVIYRLKSSNLPMDVFFIPSKKKNDEAINDYFERCFSNPNKTAFITYFQRIRWIMPEAEEIFKELDFQIMQYGTIYKDSRVSHLTLIFDSSYADEPIEDKDLIPDPTVLKVPIIYDARKYIINVQEQTISMGKLVGFKVLK